MSPFVQFLEELLYERLSDIDIGMVGRIETFNRQTMRASVTPLMKKREGEDEVEYAVLEDIPVLFLLTGDYYIRPDYKQGDLVHLTFSAHDIEQALKGEKPLESARIFSSENAFVSGGLAATDWQCPDNFSQEGLLVGHRNGTTYSCYGNGTIIHQSSDEVKIEMSDNAVTMSASGSTIEINNSGISVNGGVLTVAK